MLRVQVIITIIYILRKRHGNNKDHFLKTTRPGKDIQLFLILLVPIHVFQLLSVRWHVLFLKWASFKNSNLLNWGSVLPDSATRTGHLFFRVSESSSRNWTLQKPWTHRIDLFFRILIFVQLFFKNFYVTCDKVLLAVKFYSMLQVHAMRSH